MDKLNITSGEWNSLEDQVYSGTEGMVANCMVRGNPDEEKANTQAIVTAVNNTYKQGIDPEAVPEMHGALLEADKVLSKMNYNPDAKNINRLHHGIKLALKKAEL